MCISMVTCKLPSFAFFPLLFLLFSFLNNVEAHALDLVGYARYVSYFFQQAWHQVCLIPAGIWPPTHSWTFSATAMHSDENDRHLRAGCTTGLPSPPTTYIFPTFHVCTSGGKADHQAPFSNALKNLLHICSNHFWSFCVLHFFVLRSKKIMAEPNDM